MRTLLALVALAWALPASAHDFWLELERYRLDKPGQIAIVMKVGTAAEREEWRVRSERVVGFRSLGPTGLRDRQTEIRPADGPDPGGALVTLDTPGAHVIAFETTPALSDLAADEFNAYLEHEGLGAVAAFRKSSGAANERGRELYARRAKAIVRVGGKTGGADVTRPVGQSLEIVPLRDPHALGANESLPVRVLFRGLPLEGARVHAESFGGAANPPAAVTGADGRASFALPKTGAWKIATVWSVPIAGNDRADFDTLFASLTFGY